MSGILYDLQGPLLLRRAVCTPHRCGGDLSQRGTVQGFSPRAGARMRRFLRTCVPIYTGMATLTYPEEFSQDGRDAKRHLDSFVKRAFRYLDADSWPDQPRSIFWFLEFQERGAPHFHLFLNFSIPYDLVAAWWYDIVGSGDVRHLQAGTRIESLRSGRYGTMGYASKYAAKAEQKLIPQNFKNCGRFWGVYGDRRCVAATIFFPMETLKSAVYIDFRYELSIILKFHVKRLGKMWHKGVTSGVHLKEDAICNELKLLFLRYSMKLVVLTGRFDLYEHPTLGIPMEMVGNVPTSTGDM